MVKWRLLVFTNILILELHRLTPELGSNQARILKELQEIRIMQAQLSLKQVSLGSEKMMYGPFPPYFIV